MPSYPKRPLAKRFGSAVVVVKMTINSAGEVADVIPTRSSVTGPFVEDFFHAVETVVRNWKFTRPEWWLLTAGTDIDGNGKPDYQKVMEIKPAVASGEVEFLFDLVGGQGKVIKQ